MTELPARIGATSDRRWLAGFVCAAALVATEWHFGIWVPLALAAGLFVVALVLVMPTVAMPTELAVIPLLVAAVLTAPLSRLGLGLGSITIDPTDVGLAVACVYLLVLTTSRRFEWRVPPGHRVVLLLVVFLAVPTLTGLARGHYWQSALTGGKTAFYYLCFYVVWLLIPTKRAANRILLVILGIAIAATAYVLVARLEGLQWQNAMSSVSTNLGTVSRGYGLWSATSWYPAGCLIAVSYAWLSSATLGRRLLCAAAAAALLVATLSTLIRSDVVAISAGFLVITLASFGHGRLAAVARSRVALTVFAVLVVLVCLTPFLAHDSFVTVTLQRTESIVNGRASTVAAAANRQYRVDAALNGLRYAVQHPLGNGYGQGAQALSYQEELVQSWSYHSSVAWLGFNAGIVGLTAVCIAWLLVLREVLGRLRTETEEKWGITAVAAVLVCLTVESLGGNGLFAERFVTALLVVVLALAFVYGDSLHQRQ